MSIGHRVDRPPELSPHSDRDATAPRIAVIGVHGVADQKPGETAAAIAGLLLGIGRRPGDEPSGADSAPDESARATPPYHGFEGRALQVPLRRLHVPSADEPSAPTGARGTLRHRVRELTRLDERSGYFAALKHAPGEAAGAKASAGPGAPNDGGAARAVGDDAEPPLATEIGYEALRVQLGTYPGSDPTRGYATTRLEGRRDGPASAELHVYELYWADLSRLGRGPLAFFGGLYQLLLHLASLGRQVIDAARAEQPARRWRWLQTVHAWVVRLLVLFVPVLNWVLLVTALSAIPADRLAGAYAPWIVVVGAALLAVVAAFALVRAHVPRGPTVWALLPFAAALAGAGVAAVIVVALLRRGHTTPQGLLLVEWWLAAALLTWVALRAYQRVRPGALLVGGASLGVAIAAFYLFLAAAPGTDGPAHDVAAMWAVQLVFALLALAWRLLFLLALATLVLGAACAWRDRTARDHRDRYARTRAVLRTAQLTAAVSATAFLFTAIVVWSGIFRFTVRQFDAYRCVAASQAPLPAGLHLPAFLVPTPTQVAHWLPPALLAAPERCVNGLTARQYFAGLIASSMTTGIVPALVLLGAALFLLGWMALPSLFYEALAPAGGTNGQSRRGGAWLSRGLDATAIVTWLVWGAIFVVIPLFGTIDQIARSEGGAAAAHGVSALARAMLFFLNTGGALVAASAAAVVTAVAKYGGSALDILLDVDNYLRSGPRDAAPAARIQERFASLLRYVSRWRSDGRGYDAVVIVAHSLGTAISADQLRLIERLRRTEDSHEPALTELPPVYLFTMGSPLRQLMNRFFPHRFWWVRDVPDNGWMPLGETPDELRAAGRPLPSSLGVAGWSNAYRSGDYVGRALWLGEWYSRTAGPDDAGRVGERLKAFTAAHRWEACIGAGAHTHYWDGSAPDIADHLDEIIRRAAAVTT